MFEHDFALEFEEHFSNNIMHKVHVQLYAIMSVFSVNVHTVVLFFFFLILSSYNPLKVYEDPPSGQSPRPDLINNAERKSLVIYPLDVLKNVFFRCCLAEAT